MSPDRIEELLRQVASGEISTTAAVEQLKVLPFSELGHTTLDTHRELRQGIPEAVYGAGKSAEQLIEILQHLHHAHQRALATRVNRRKASQVQEALPEANYNAVSRLLTVGDRPEAP